MSGPRRVTRSSSSSQAPSVATVQPRHAPSRSIRVTDSPTPTIHIIRSPSPPQSISSDSDDADDVVPLSHASSRSTDTNRLAPPRNTGKAPRPIHPYFESVTSRPHVPPRSPARGPPLSTSSPLVPPKRSTLTTKAGKSKKGSGGKAASAQAVTPLQPEVVIVGERVEDEEEEEEQEEIETVRDGLFFQGDRPPVPVCEARTYTDPVDKFLSLQHLPHIQSQLPIHLHSPFRDAARRCAQSYLDHPTEDTLLSFLALVKVGLPPKRLGKSDNPVQRLANYPMVPWPKPPEDISSGHATNPVSKAEKLVRRGKLGQAGKALVAQGKVALYSEGVGRSLQGLHPAGEHHPFGSKPGPMQGTPPSKELITSCLAQFNKETSPGISGWTVPLLLIVAKDPIIINFLHTLTIQIFNGTAPGAQMLCASRITPLLKKEELGVAGGIRPIAVGEVVYRLAMKAVVKATVKRGMLASTQFGVNTKGGVEPVIRLVDRAMKKDTPVEYRYVTSLDFRNAFNTLQRKMIVSGLAKHAPTIYRCAKWAYNDPTPLVVPGAPPSSRPLVSSEGVRQGDPLGPFLFSVAYRPIIERLQESLGSDCIVVAYLDDTYILSRFEDPMPKVTEFFSRPDSSLELNLSKCKTLGMEEIRKDGFALLGTMIGPESARRAFLTAKVDSQIAKLESLSLLGQHQYSLLIFRSCFQHDLRHLQRSLDTSDLGDVWDRLDTAYTQIIINMRSSVGTRDHDQELISLPVKMGGMGILSHRECSGHARAAAEESADEMVKVILDEGLDDEVREEVRGQGERCKEMLELRRDVLMGKLEDKERKAMVENGQKLGRKWLTSIPYNKSGELDDFELSANLHYRTLTPPHLPCRHCGSEIKFGHDELCRGETRPQFTIIRHNAIVNAWADALRSIGVAVQVEPPTTDHGSRRRNDLLVWGSRQHGMATTEYDVKVYSILGDKVHKSTGVVRGGLTEAPSADAGPWEKTLGQCLRYLTGVSRETKARVAGGQGHFEPLVFSSGGFIEPGTQKVLEAWRAAVGDVVWERTLSRVSLGLARARARTWEAGGC